MYRTYRVVSKEQLSFVQLGQRYSPSKVNRAGSYEKIGVIDNRAT